MEKIEVFDYFKTDRKKLERIQSHLMRDWSSDYLFFERAVYNYINGIFEDRRKYSDAYYTFETLMFYINVIVSFILIFLTVPLAMFINSFIESLFEIELYDFIARSIACLVFVGIIAIIYFQWRKKYIDRFFYRVFEKRIKARHQNNQLIEFYIDKLLKEQQ